MYEIFEKTTQFMMEYLKNWYDDDPKDFQRALRADYRTVAETYDRFFGYRFLTRLRNYVVHYDIPLSSVSSYAADGIDLLCIRNNLLNYDGWSTLKVEICQLPEAFSVQPYIEESLVVLDTLYLKALEIVADNVVAANGKITEFCKEYKISSPVILVIDSIKEKKTHIEKFPLNDMNEYFRDLNRHPNYNIRLNKK